MGQVNSDQLRILQPGESFLDSRHALPVATPPQARRDFDAAMRRADSGEEERSEADESEAAAGALGVLVPAAAGAAALAGISESIGAGAAGSAAPTPGGGTLPDAVPMRAGAVPLGAIDQQWRISVPGDANSATAMSMRLISSGAGHWQVRLAADNHTRQQLTPHLDRLRDKLRERGGDRFDDLTFDDDPGTLG